MSRKSAKIGGGNFGAHFPSEVRASLFLTGERLKRIKWPLSLGNSKYLNWFYMEAQVFKLDLWSKSLADFRLNVKDISSSKIFLSGGDKRRRSLKLFKQLRTLYLYDLVIWSLIHDPIQPYSDWVEFCRDWHGCLNYFKFNFGGATWALNCIFRLDIKLEYSED